MRAGGEHLVPRRANCGDVTEIAEIGVIRLLSYLRQALVHLPDVVAEVEGRGKATDEGRMLRLSSGAPPKPRPRVTQQK